MTKKSKDQKGKTTNKDDNDVQSIKNQLNKSYQQGVIEDKLNNNKDIHTFNNQSK